MLNGTANMMTAPSMHNSSNMYSDLPWQFMPLWQDGLGRKRYIEVLQVRSGPKRQRPAPGLFGPVAEGRIVNKQVSAFCTSGQCCLALQVGRGNVACRSTNA